MHRYALHTRCARTRGIQEKYQPTAAMDLGISVLSIGALFQAYYEVFEFSTNEKWVPVSDPIIVLFLSKNL